MCGSESGNIVQLDCSFLANGEKLIRSQIDATLNSRDEDLSAAEKF
jgi:hypothetical protein